MMAISMKEVSRRQFCRSAITLPMLAATGLNLTGCANLSATRFVSGATDATQQDYLVVFNDSGELLHQVALANRAHDIVAIDKQHVVAVSRRPFTQLFVVNIESGECVKQITAQSGFHFYGHAAVDTKRNQLITTENEIVTGRGKLVFRNLITWLIDDVVDSGGIGPHQCALLNSKDVLVVANGGILTHPKERRKKLNLTTMKPNLSYFELASKRLIEQVTPPHFQLSLRHFAISDTDQVIIGAQYQGYHRDTLPLIYSHQLGEKLQPLKAPAEFWQQMQHYTASVSIDNGAGIVGVSSPRGGVIGYWQLANRTLITSQKFTDCAGITFSKEGFMLTNGKGQLKYFVANLQQPLMAQQGLKLRFDNHLIAVG